MPPSRHSCHPATLYHLAGSWRGAGSSPVRAAVRAGQPPGGRAAPATRSALCADRQGAVGRWDGQQSVCWSHEGLVRARLELPVGAVGSARPAAAPPGRGAPAL